MSHWEPATAARPDRVCSWPNGACAHRRDSASSAVPGFSQAAAGMAPDQPARVFLGDRLLGDGERGIVPHPGEIVAVRAIPAGQGKNPLELALLTAMPRSVGVRRPREWVPAYLGGLRLDESPPRTTDLVAGADPDHHCCCAAGGDSRPLLSPSLALRALAGTRVFARRRQRRVSPTHEGPPQPRDRSRVTCALLCNSIADEVSVRLHARSASTE